MNGSSRVLGDGESQERSTAANMPLCTTGRPCVDVRNPRRSRMACQTNVSLRLDDFTREGFREVCGVNMPGSCRQISAKVSLV